jgi:hypothetical protein
MSGLNTKADKLKRFGFVPSDVVLVCCAYTDLFEMTDKDDAEELTAIADKVGLVDDLLTIVSAMESHPEESVEAENLTRFYNLVCRHNSKSIRKWVSLYLFSAPEEVVISAQQFDTTKHKVHMHIEMKIFHRDIVKLSDDFLNRCGAIIVDTDMGQIPIYASEP